MKKIKIILSIFFLVHFISSCWNSISYTIWEYTLKWKNKLMNHSIYKNWDALFKNVDLIYEVFENGNFILCNWVEFIKEWKNINDFVIDNEDTIINTISSESPYDKQIAKECIAYNWKEEKWRITNVLLHSYNLQSKGHMEKYKEFITFLKKYK